MSGQQENPKTLRERALALFNKVNLYEDDESLVLNDQLLATKLYLLLLLLSLLSLLIFTGSSVQTIVVTVESPTENVFRQLSTNYPSTLVCPCSRISISYGKFMNFSPEYHQICTSDFIRSTWISSLFNWNATNAFPMDFRLIAPSQFQMLSTFCQSSEETISDILQSFSASEIITSNALFPSTFDQKMSTLVDQMRAVTIADNARIDQLLSLSVSQNRPLTGLRTNTYMRNVPGSNGFSSFSAFYFNKNFDQNNFSSTPPSIDDSCACSSSFDCHFPSALFNTTIFIVPGAIVWPNPTPVSFITGIETGCVSRTSLGRSTLECLFDQTCLNQISRVISPFASVRPLNRSQSSRYNITTRVEDIFYNLMAESWNEMSNFTGYYQGCAPQTCTYSYTRRFSFVYMITTLVGLFGGLTVVIQILSPLLVKNILRRNRPPTPTGEIQQENEEINMEERKLGSNNFIIKCFLFVKTKIVTFNLFKNTSMDLVHETYSTRLYVLLLVIAFIILTIYLSIIRTTQTVTIDKPSLETFETLYRDHSSTLTCPCEQLSTKYSELMFIEAHYHQICSSVFLTDQWLIYWSLNLVNDSDPNAPPISGQDFRNTGSALFNLLRIFCDFAVETIDNALIVFNSTDFVTAQLLGRNEFNLQTATLANQFIKTTSQSFKVTFELISSSIRLNQLLMFGNTNAIPRSRLYNGTYQLRYVARTFTKDNRTCSCDTSTQCARQQGFYCRNLTCLSGNALPNRPIPGLNYACFPIDSILVSTLECFFNQSCIQMLIDNRLYDLQDYYVSINLTNIIALDVNLKSQYYPNTTLETIISQLFVENWTTSADFMAHYQQCQPKYCTYTYIERYQAVFIVTSVIGLVGGLTVVFEIFVPLLMRILLRIFRRRHDEFRHLSVIRRFFHNFRQWNIYEEETTEGDHPFIATRIYVVLLIIALIVITIFITFQQQTYSFTVTSPTETEFRLLNEKYSSTLSCPCSQLAVRYETFLHLSPTLHSICSSIFVTSNWSTTLANKGDIWNTPDWFVLSTQYRLLTSMCQLSEEILDRSIYEFLAHQLVNTETLAPDSFQQQVDAASLLFIEHLPKEFRRTLAFIHQTFQSNQFTDRYMSTWQLTHSNINESYVLRWLPIHRNNNTCLCAAGTSTCSRPLIFLNSSNRSVTIPGFIDGCFAMYGLRQSTFECLFDQSCLNQLLNLLNYSILITALNASSSTIYPPNNTLIGTIIDELFVENWIKSSDYTSYYRICAPSTCQYSYVDRNDIIYIITTVLGLYGGLTEALRMIVWHGIRIMTKLFRRFYLFRARVRQVSAE